MGKASQRERREAMKRALKAETKKRNYIDTKEDFQKQVTQTTPLNLSSKLRVLPKGNHDVQSIGACPSVYEPIFHYACTVDGKIWKINDCNHDWVNNMVSLALGPYKIKPFPCQVVVQQDGKIKVADDSHIDAEREEQLRNDPIYSQEVAKKWFNPDVKVEECFVCKRHFVCVCANEKFEKPKYRSCAMREEYPQSRLHSESGGCYLIHICSMQCERNYDDPMIKKMKARGMKSMTMGEYTQWYDPEHTTEEEVVKKLRVLLGDASESDDDNEPSL